MGQFIWEYYHGEKKKLMYSFSIRQLEIHLGTLKWKGKVHLYVRFQFGNSFGNTNMGKYIYIVGFNYAIHLGILTWKKRCIHKNIRFQLGHSFGNTNMGKKKYIFVFN